METIEELKNRQKKIDEMIDSLEKEREETHEKIDRLVLKGFDKFVGKAYKNTSASSNRTTYCKILKVDRYNPEADVMRTICLRVKFDDRGVSINTQADCLLYSSFAVIEEEEFQDAMNRALEIISKTNEEIKQSTSR